MIARDIIAALEGFAPLSIQESWDNSGLCIGSPDWEVPSVLLGFDCTPELIDEAVALGAGMVITHHPLIFGGLKKIDPRDPVGEAVIKAIRGGIAVYAAHTSADKVERGVSGAMARRLGLRNICILDSDGEDSGLGAIGDLPEPLSYDEALALVKRCFGLQTVRSSKPLTQPVSRVAMCGGSGSSLIEKARSQGAQLYISADISYHHFFTPDGFAIMDIGHFESEVEIVDILFSYLRKKFPNFAVYVSKTLAASNPVKYL